jgi:alkylated DNA repair dioxygenase AlkB
VSGLLESPAVERLALPDAELRWWPRWLEDGEADALCAALWSATPWEQSEITIAGRRLRIPRHNAWYGDPGAAYGYSGTRLARNPWTPRLAALRDRVQRATGARFNSALLNCYRSGADSVDWHSDDEPELGPAPVIAVLSLGAPRRFELRHRTRPGLRRRLDLGGGSLLLMAGPMQAHWQHRIPKQPEVAGVRISLTFRLAGERRAWARDPVADPGTGC